MTPREKLLVITPNPTDAASLERIAAELQRLRSSLDVRWCIPGTLSSLLASIDRERATVLHREDMVGAIDGQPFAALSLQEGSADNVAIGEALLTNDLDAFDYVAIAPPDDRAAGATSPLDWRGVQHMVRMLQDAPGAKWALLQRAGDARATHPPARADGFLLRGSAATMLCGGHVAADAPGGLGLVSMAQLTMSGVRGSGTTDSKWPRPWRTTPTVARRRRSVAPTTATEAPTPVADADAALAAPGSVARRVAAMRDVAWPTKVQSVGVITPAHTRYLHHLDDAYQSLRAQDLGAGRRLRWHLRIDGPVDADAARTLERLRRQADTDGVALQLSTNGAHLGIANSANAALDDVEEDVVVYFDADDVLQDDAISTIIGHLEQHPEAGYVIGSTQHFPYGGGAPTTSTACTVVPIGELNSEAVRQRSARKNEWCSVGGKSPYYGGEHLLGVRTPLVRALGGRGPLTREEDFFLLYRLDQVAVGIHDDRVLRHRRVWNGQVTNDVLGVHDYRRLIERIRAAAAADPKVRGPEPAAQRVRATAVDRSGRSQRRPTTGLGGQGVG